MHKITSSESFILMKHWLRIKQIVITWLRERSETCLCGSFSGGWRILQDFFTLQMVNESKNANEMHICFRQYDVLDTIFRIGTPKSIDFHSANIMQDSVISTDFKLHYYQHHLT